MTIEYDDCLKRGKIKPFSRGPALAVSWGKRGQSHFCLFPYLIKNDSDPFFISKFGQIAVIGEKLGVFIRF